MRGTSLSRESVLRQSAEKAAAAKAAADKAAKVVKLVKEKNRRLTPQEFFTAQQGSTRMEPSSVSKKKLNSLGRFYVCLNKTKKKCVVVV